MVESDGDNPAPDVIVHLVFIDEKSKAFMERNELASLNGLDNENFKKVSKEFGKQYDLLEFEMFWNTGEIPAFCNFRFIKS